MQAGRPLSPLVAFLKGFKPALLEVPNGEFASDVVRLLGNGYPYVSERMIDLLGGRRFFLYFQNEAECIRFRTAFAEEDKDRGLGLALGFPPKAVDWFVRMQTAKRSGNLEQYRQMKDRKIGMGYCGCLFVCDVGDFLENARWLLDTYPYREAKEAGMYVRTWSHACGCRSTTDGN
ncbi:hypothetical protein [Staphylospora marina]|uniref:hypothetical protein n=1 Tax=Staphylospora marina TaxID=2490858 RepID=UPI000F5B9F99|nr:hypothetical protein [Staphylospora marina]